MNAITVETKMSDLMSLPELQAYRRYMLFTPQGAPANDPLRDARVQDLAAIGWSPEGIAAGMNCFLAALEAGRVEQYFIYDEAECAAEPDKKYVNLIRITPEKTDPDKPIVVLCAGGGYQTVCTMVEALPTARHMVEAGYTVFLLTYRVGKLPAAILALNDLAAAIRWLGEHASELGVDASRYAIGGYSAGANLVSNWGCANIGWKRYGAPKPLCMFPIYTFIDLKAESHRDEKAGIVMPMLGEDWPQRIDDYNVVDHIDQDYPPCYIVCGKDDAMVPCVNSELMKQRLDAAGVPAILEEGEHAAHGFGDGTGTDVEGWPGRALAFLESL